MGMEPHLATSSLPLTQPRKVGVSLKKVIGCLAWIGRRGDLSKVGFACQRLEAWLPRMDWSPEATFPRVASRVANLSPSAFGWLPRMDSNHDTQIQNLQCYRYTTRQ